MIYWTVPIYFILNYIFFVYLQGNKYISSNQAADSLKENESTKVGGIENVQIENALRDNPFSVQITDNSTQRICYTYDEVSGNARNFPTEKISNRDQINHFRNESKHRTKRVCDVPLLIFSIVFLCSSLLILCLIMVLRTNSDFQLKPCDSSYSHTYMNPQAEKRIVIRNISGSIRQLMKNSKNNIVHLDLSFNRISFMNFSELGEFSLLRVLSLSHNNIQRTDGIERMPELQELDISFNRLQGIDELHKQTKSCVRFLNTSGNSIFSLQHTDFSNFPCLEFLDISNNPIQKPFFVRFPTCLLTAICKSRFNSSTILIDCSHVVSMLPTHTKPTRAKIISAKETSTVNRETNRIPIQMINEIGSTLRRTLESLFSTIRILSFPISTLL